MATVQQLIEGYGESFPSLEHLLGIEAEAADTLRLDSPSPALSRYLKNVSFMQDVCSGKELAKRSFQVAIEYVIQLSEELEGYQGIHKDKKIIRALTPAEKTALRGIDWTTDDIVRAEFLEKWTDHDIAARMDYAKIKISEILPDLEQYMEAVHFAITSEDNISTAFGMICNELVYAHLIPKVIDFGDGLIASVDELETKSPLVLPGLTHQQAAEPTTWGKIVATTLRAIDFHIGEDLVGKNGKFKPFSGKLGGATGNLTTQLAAYSDIDWISFSQRFVEGHDLHYESLTHQSVTYAAEASIFTALANILTHVNKFTKDFVHMASCPAQLFVKEKKAGRKGSSIMPNKSNPWAQEGAQRMLRECRDNLFRYAAELPDFPREGDMGRSYLMRQFGTTLMPAFIGIHRIGREISNYNPNHAKIDAFFHEYPGMSGSAMQTVMKREGIEGDAYRIMQEISFNRDSTYANAQQYQAGLEAKMEEHDLPEAMRDELRGFLDMGKLAHGADMLAKKGLSEIRERFADYKTKLEGFKR